MKFFQRENLEVYLNEQWQTKGWSIADRKRVGVEIQELVDHSSSRNQNVRAPFLDLWLLAFDEMLSWNLSLITVFYSGSTPGNLNNFDRAVTILLMKIFGDGLAIRNLILSGFDGAACTTLRSTAEYMEVLLAIIHDPTLSDAFIESQTPDAAKLFWEKNLRSGKLRVRVKAAWRSFFTNKSDIEAALWFADWGYRSFEKLSAMSHPSFGGGLLTIIPLKSQHTEENWLGCWGDKSDASVETISIFAAFLFPILLLDPEFPFKECEKSSGSEKIYDTSNEFHFHVKHGRDVITSMILSLHNPDNREMVFPEADLSIFKDN